MSGKHSTPHGEEGTKTAETRGGSGDYHGKHRDGEAAGTSAQQYRDSQTTRSDLPHRDEGR